MTAIYSIVAGVLMAGAVYLALSRDVVRLTLGLMLMTGGVNLSVLVAGRISADRAPFIPKGLTGLPAEAIVNPLPQAIVLTAIVIGFGVFAFMMALLVRLVARLRTANVDAMREVERQGPSSSDAKTRDVP